MTYTIERCRVALDQTRCCPKYMRAFLIDNLTGKAPEYQERFLDRRVAFVRSEVEPVADREPEFDRLCADLAGARDPRAVAEGCPVEEVWDEYGQFRWEQLADHALARRDHWRVLFTLANAWLQLDFRHDHGGPADYRAALARWARKNYHGPMPHLDSPAMTAAEGALRGRLIQAHAALRDGAAA